VLDALDDVFGAVELGEQGVLALGGTPGPAAKRELGQGPGIVAVLVLAPGERERGLPGGPLPGVRQARLANRLRPKGVQVEVQDAGLAERPDLEHRLRRGVEEVSDGAAVAAAVPVDDQVGQAELPHADGDGAHGSVGVLVGVEGDVTLHDGQPRLEAALEHLLVEGGGAEVQPRVDVVHHGPQDARGLGHQRQGAPQRGVGSGA
jgi:hypothetical protein